MLNKHIILNLIIFYVSIIDKIKADIHINSPLDLAEIFSRKKIIDKK